MGAAKLHKREMAIFCIQLTAAEPFANDWNIHCSYDLKNIPIFEHSILV